MAIYDCFQYFNEDEMVDLRLNVLHNYVDYFHNFRGSQDLTKEKLKKLILILIIFQNLKIKSNLLLLNIKKKLIYNWQVGGESQSNIKETL